MIKKDDIQGGQKKLNPRPTPEKEKVMKTTKIQMVLIMVCVGFFALQGYAAADDDVQATQKINTDSTISSTGTGLGGVLMVPALIASIFAPYMVAPAAVMVNSTVGMIAGAVTTDWDSNQEINTETVLVADDNQEITTEVQLAAADKE
jgi:uncharacterized YccA/Bax inhibitor family protein